MNKLNRYLCVVYVSEGVNTGIIQSLVDYSTSSMKSSYLAHQFIDKSYNRTSYYFIGSNIVDDLVSFCSHAFKSLDFRIHQGTHPTLGSIDHVCFSPLESTSIDYVSTQAISFCNLINSSHNIPIYCYGKASNSNNQLKDIRKQLGYFNNKSLYIGSQTINTITSLSTNKDFIHPNYGDIESMDQSKGLICVGVVPLVINLNIKYKDTIKSLISKVTKQIRSPEVQALTLEHDNNSYEVACNLLQSKRITTNDVINKVIDISNQLGLTIDSYYTTGPTEEELIDKHNNYLNINI